ncbi:MAG: hypothetical protein ACE5JM_06315 [Armatimonadota bacterium]
MRVVASRSERWKRLADVPAQLTVGLTRADDPEAVAEGPTALAGEGRLP